MKLSNRAGSAPRATALSRLSDGTDGGIIPSQGKAGGGRRWTKREEDYVRRQYRTAGAAAIASALGRTVAAVNDRAKYLGVRSGRARPWTTAELRYLEKNYPRRSADQIARTLGRTLQSVRGQIHLKGLGSEPSERWSQKEIAFIQKEYGRMSIAEIAQKLGRSAVAVQLKGGKLGLQRKVRQPTGKEIAWIVANLGRVSMDDMSRRLDVSISAVQKIAKEHEYAPKAHLRRWTGEEDEFIRKNYASMTSKEIGAAIDRSVDMVSWRTRKLGLTDGAQRKQLRWTAAEEKILIASVGKMDRVEIARRLDRTVRAVEGRVEKLRNQGKIR